MESTDGCMLLHDIHWKDGNKVSLNISQGLLFVVPWDSYVFLCVSFNRSPWGLTASPMHLMEGVYVESFPYACGFLSGFPLDLSAAIFRD